MAVTFSVRNDLNVCLTSNRVQSFGIGPPPSLGHERLVSFEGLNRDPSRDARSPLLRIQSRERARLIDPSQNRMGVGPELLHQLRQYRGATADGDGLPYECHIPLANGDAICTPLLRDYGMHELTVYDSYNQGNDTLLAQPGPCARF